MTDPQVYAEMKGGILRLVYDLYPITFYSNIGGKEKAINEEYFKKLFDYHYELKKDKLRKSKKRLTGNREDAIKLLKVEAWNALKGKLMETLYALSIIQLYLPPNQKARKINLSSSKKPVQINFKDKIKFLWLQSRIQNTQSGLDAIPDLTITNNDQQPNQNNIHTILECKCVERLDAGTIRKEFGKAYDTNVVNYTIVNYYYCNPELKTKANQLGLELIEFRPLFDKFNREQIETEVKSQTSIHLSNATFYQRLQETNQSVRRKLLNN